MYKCTTSDVYEWTNRTLGSRALEYLCTLHHIPVYVHIVKYHHYFRRQACDNGIFSDALHEMHVFQSTTLKNMAFFGGVRPPFNPRCSRRIRAASERVLGVRIRAGGSPSTCTAPGGG